MISIVMSLVACLSQHFNVMIRYHVGDVSHDLLRPVWSAQNLVGAVSGIDAKGFQTFEFVHPEFFSGLIPRFCTD